MTSVIITGVIQGLLYAVMASGFVLVYRVSGALNFAHGALGTVGAYIAFSLTSFGYSYWLSASVGITVGVVVAYLINVLVIRRLDEDDHISIAIATLGITIALIAVCLSLWGATEVSLKPPLSRDPLFAIGQVSISLADLVTVAIVIAIFGGLSVTMRHTSFGLAMRAVNEGPATASLLGINVRLTRSSVWAISGGLAVVAGLLIVPSTHLNPNGLTTFFIASFAVVVLGGLESINGVFLGGIAFGIVNSLFAYLVTPRLLNTFSLLVIVIVLVVFPNGLFGRPSRKVNEPRVSRRHVKRGIRDLDFVGHFSLPFASGRTRYLANGTLNAALLAVVAIVPLFLVGSSLLAISLAAAAFFAVLGQFVLTGQVGLTSIGQSGFMVVGIYGVVMLGTHFDMPPIPSSIVAVLAAALVATLLAIVSARLKGVYLALVTISFALSLPELAAFDSRLAGGATGTTVPAIGPISLTTERHLVYYAILLLAVLAFAGIALLKRSTRGRAWRAVRDSEIGAASLGISVLRTKVEATAIAGGLAALGGILSASLIGYVAPSSFTLWTSIYILAAMVIGGGSSLRGATLGTLLVFALPIMLSAYANLLQIAFGLAIVVVLVFFPQGVGRLFESKETLHDPQSCKEPAR